MITCGNCGTEYEDHASYCNICDVPLTDEGGINMEEEVSGDFIDAEELLSKVRHETLSKARKTASGVHRLLGWIYFILLAVAAFILAMGHDTKIDDYWFLLIFVLPAIVHLLAAEGLVRNKSWARPLSIIVGFILLFGFPIGTIFGFVILNQMFKKEWKSIIVA